MDPELREYLDQRFSQIDARLDRVETEVRAAHIRIEDLQGQIQIVAEGVTNVQEQLRQHRKEFSRHVEAFTDLELRVRRLEAAS